MAPRPLTGADKQRVLGTHGHTPLPPRARFVYSSEIRRALGTNRSVQREKADPPIHGPAFSVPASWEAHMFRDLAAVDSDPDTVKSTCDRNGSHTAWYIRHYGEYASMRECVDDNWSYSGNKREEFKRNTSGRPSRGATRRTRWTRRPPTVPAAASTTSRRAARVPSSSTTLRGRPARLTKNNWTTCSAPSTSRATSRPPLPPPKTKWTFPRSSTGRTGASPSYSASWTRRVQAGSPMRKSIDWAAETASSS